MFVAQKTGFELTQTPILNFPDRPLPRTNREQRPVFVVDSHLLVSCRSSSRGHVIPA